MDSKLSALLKNNYYEPNAKETEVFINNFHKYRIQKQKERKTNFLAILLLCIVTVCGFSIVLKETSNKLDIQTSLGEIQK